VPDAVLEALTPEDFDPRLVGWAREEILEAKEITSVIPNLLQLLKGPRFGDRVAVAARRKILYFRG
jgi:hypothetical protein